MCLGTPRLWWIAAGVWFVAALALIGTDIGGTLGNVVGVLLLFASIGVFGMSPMRYGQGSRRPTTSPTEPAEADPLIATDQPRREQERLTRMSPEERLCDQQRIEQLQRDYQMIRGLVESS